MERRFGVEASMGIGGGQVSEESQKCLDVAEGLVRKKKYKEALPHFMKAIELDPNNLDAIIHISDHLCFEDGTDVLLKAEERGRDLVKKALRTTKAFDDDGGCVGHFWSLIETRPYMRVLQALARIYFQWGKPNKSINFHSEMLRLCPGDNLGQRFTLGSVLLAAKRYSDALYFSQQWLHDDVVRTGGPPCRGGTAFGTPLTALPSQELVDDARSAECSLVYTAALASYKLRGDCLQSRKYLEVAAECNPSILVKILARVEQPTKPCYSSRAANGPEDAQDYLWLTQNLWMMPDVWNWADKKVPKAKDAILKKCDHVECQSKEKRVAEYKRCSACHLVSYCSPECQKTDWSRHKPACLEHKRVKESRRADKAGKVDPHGKPGLSVKMDLIAVGPNSRIPHFTTS